jgi:branched-chain amino acid transport system substrate-binding protein
MFARPRSRRIAIAALGVLPLAVAGCGLKQNAVDSLSAKGAVAAPAGGGSTGGATGAGTGGGSGLVTGSGGAGSTGSTGFAGTSGTTGSTGFTGTTGSSGGTSGATSGATGATSGATGAATGSTTGSTRKPCSVPTGGDTTGITAKTINIGLHAPLTGTGTPFPNTSFKTGSNVFWQQKGHKICGRQVQVDFQDDTYTPSGARTVCSAFARRDFLAIGGGGTDQIQACATDPDIQRTGTPYLSAGVTTNGLSNLSNYFAVSLTYQQQGTLVVQNAKAQGIASPKASRVGADHGGKAVWAIVTGNSPNFDGATVGIQQALDHAGIPYKTFRVDQNGNYQAAATHFGSTLALDGFKTIYVDAAPGFFVFMTGGYYGSAAGANWVGPGVTYTEVTVAQYICTSTKNAVSKHAWFLAPAPGIDRATSDFKKAYNGNYDDIEWSLWGLSMAVWHLFNDANSNLTRQNFIATASRTVVPGGVYPPLDFLHRGGHFGGTGAWVQRVNCGEREPDQKQLGAWDTIGSHYLKLT